MFALMSLFQRFHLWNFSSFGLFYLWISIREHSEVEREKVCWLTNEPHPPISRPPVPTSQYLPQFMRQPRTTFSSPHNVFSLNIPSSHVWFNEQLCWVVSGLLELPASGEGVGMHARQVAVIGVQRDNVINEFTMALQCSLSCFGSRVVLTRETQVNECYALPAQSG